MVVAVLSVDLAVALPSDCTALCRVSPSLGDSSSLPKENESGS